MSDHVVCLKGMLESDLFAMYSPSLFQLSTLEPEYKRILGVMQKYYKEYETTGISLDELRTAFRLEYPAIKDHEIYDAIFDQIERLHIDNTELLHTALKRVEERHYIDLILAEGANYANGASKEGMERVAALVDKWREADADIGVEDPDECTATVHEILSEIAKDGLRWPLKGLHELTGPVYPGTLGHIFARPETGKTALCVHLLNFFAVQLHQQGIEEPVLYLTNEEDPARTKIRGYSSILNMPVKSFGDLTPEDLLSKVTKKGGHLVKYVGGANTLADVQKKIVHHKPRVVIVDQGPKVSVNGDYPQHQARQMVYQTFRQWATKYHLIFISIGQADSAAENKKFLTYQHIDGSKVGIPGECDYIIGIGKSEKDSDLTRRYFTVSKNKLGGELGRFTTRLDVFRNRYLMV